MLSLIVSMCLLDNPTKCKVEHFPIEDQRITEIQCVMGSMVDVAKNMEKYPRWRATKWTCKDSTRVTFRDM
jgi:hypothetical protein